MPEILKLSVALLVLGALAELIYNASPSAAYTFILLLLLGYAASGGRYAAIEQFIAGLNKVSTPQTG